MKNRLLKIGSVFAVIGALAGCQTTGSTAESAYLPTKAPLPKKVEPYGPIDDVLACIKDTGVLYGKTFEVGPFADSTGKVNASAVGATGNFLPQGGSASFITDAIAKAGGRVVTTYFGAPTRAVRTHYKINGIFNSLDFGTKFSGDVRVSGIGPTVRKGWAQLTLTIQLDQAHTNLNQQISMIQRPVRYSQLGLGVGRTFGNTLASGSIVFENQERLQFEAVNGPIALGVADVIMKQFPSAEAHCEKQMNSLVNT